MGSSSEKQKPSAQDIALAKKGVADARIFDQYYMPLEQQAIASVSGESGDRNRQIQNEFLAGRGNADIAAEEQQAKAANVAASIQQGVALDSTSSTASRRELGASVAEASNANIVDSAQSARNNQDRERLGVINTGRDVNRQALSSLTNVARMSNSRSLNKIRNKAMTDNAKSQALGQVLMAGAVKGKSEFDRGTDKSKSFDANGKPIMDADGNNVMKNTYDDSELNFISRGFRSKFN